MAEYQGTPDLSDVSLSHLGKNDEEQPAKPVEESEDEAASDEETTENTEEPSTGVGVSNDQ